MKMSVRSLVPGLALLLGLSSPVMGQQATVTGRVTDAQSGQPIPSAQVSVTGTSLGGLTNTDGRYVIRGLTPGTATVRVVRIGYSEAQQEVNLTANATATADFTLTFTPIMMDPVVTTATGEQRRIEVGNSIAQVNAAEVTETRAVSDMGDLLTARAAGVQVLPGTQTGAGFRVRIRGTSSLSLSNNPIFIIDGIRMESSTGSAAISVGGTNPGRVGDLNPEEIESIEVVRGPSAATLYGTDAANGVVVITTKRGVAGRTELTYYTEQTAIVDNNDYPDAYRAWRNTSTPSNTAQCFLFQVTSGACQQDSVSVYNLHDDPEATPYGVGYRQQHGLQLRGGSDAIRYFLSAEWEDETGVLKVPEFEERYLAARGLSLRPEEERPNALNRVATRANLNIQLREDADLAVSVGYTTQDIRRPRSDDSGTAGVAANTYGGPGFKYNLSPQGDTLYGWRQFTPRTIYQQVTNQSIERFITSAAANWVPREWLAFRANAGVDYTHRLDTQLCRFGECPPIFDYNQGRSLDFRTNFYLYTVDAAGTATRRISDRLESRTSVGLQYYRNIFNRNGITGTFLPPGAVTVTAAAVKDADEATTESRTFGAYVEQQFSFNDRLFLTGAVRTDRNSAFGADFSTAFYPKFSASWVVSEEAFFPQLEWMDQVRLRLAYGASGVQPGTTDAVQFYGTNNVALESGEFTGLTFSTLGNRNLKPERSSELEMGADLTLFQGRLTTELTYYNKSSRDALVSRILPPSLGTGATARLENLGEVRNWGWEGLLNAQIITTPALGWDVSVNGSMNSNELVSLGGLPPIVSSSTIQQREGFPLNAWFARRIESFADTNGDGLIERSEIEVSEDPEYHGYSMPRYEVALTNGLDFWDRRLRLTAQMDYKGGHLVYNNSERIRCSSRNNCRGLLDPTAPLREQAAVIALRQNSPATNAGYFEEGDFIRFRELGLSFTPPSEWANSLFGGRRLVATLAARNLGILWTKYSGVDPEAFASTGNAPSSFQAFGPQTYYSLRLSFGF